MFTLPDLPYSFNSLEPYIDASTMEIHHDKHHATYVKNLNDAAAQFASLAASDESKLEEILTNIDSVPADVRQKVRNHGGGHFNHTFFWGVMTPKQIPPSDAFISRINSTFGSMDVFKEKFTTAAATLFGSGWAWLVLDKNQLEIITTSNQDSPLSLGKKPVLCIDVWEHAYYLKYQNKRAEYISAWWNLINWPFVETLAKP